MKRPYDIVQYLYGSETYYYRAVAFCKHHHKHLTTKMVKQHKCLGKQCRFLDKIETHPYWQSREKKKFMKGGK